MENHEHHKDASRQPADKFERLLAVRLGEQRREDRNAKKHARRPGFAWQATQCAWPPQANYPDRQDRALEHLDVVQIQEAQRDQRLDRFEGQADKECQNQPVRDALRV